MPHKSKAVPLMKTKIWRDIIKVQRSNTQNVIKSKKE